MFGKNWSPRSTELQIYPTRNSEITSKSCPFSLLFRVQSAVGAAPAEGARGPEAGVRQAPAGAGRRPAVPGTFFESWGHFRCYLANDTIECANEQHFPLFYKSCWATAFPSAQNLDVPAVLASVLDE